MRSFAEDYRQLISLPFACVLLGAAFATLPRRGRAFALGAACLFLGLASNINAGHWRTEETLWGRAVALGTTSMGHLNYGISVRQRDPALAKIHYERSLELNPNNAYAKINLALQMIHNGMVEEGLALAKESTTEVPHWALTQHWLSRAYLSAGRREEAIAPAVRANDLEPNNPYYRDQLSLLLHGYSKDLQQGGEAPASLPLLELLHSKVERFQDSQFQHAWALHDSGELDEAVIWYQKHLAAEPTNKQARCNLAYALRDLDRKEDAADELRKVLAMDPSHADARALLQSLDG
jgi:tetratricopeptide (TPR) repeat protein